MSFDQIITKVDDFVWGWPLMICILAVGLLLTVCSGLIQVKHIGKAFRFMFRKDKEAQGDVSTFGALCTALSATIGTGNIVGVATAVCTGGPGALFWMVVAAFFGMATKFAECFLAVKYRKIELKNIITRIEESAKEYTKTLEKVRPIDEEIYKKMKEKGMV